MEKNLKHSNNHLYLDYNASAPLLGKVGSEMERVSTLYFNPSGLYAKQEKEELADARARVAKAVNAREDEVVFTSSGTESNFLAIVGGLLPKKIEGEFPKFLTSSAEHKATLEIAKFLSESKMADAFICQVDRDTVLDLNSLEEFLKEKPSLVSLIWANNETGAINPIKEILELKNKLSPNTLVHLDGAQCLGKVEVDFADLGVDFLSLSSHKAGGPKGAAALIIKKGTRFKSPIVGGGQEEQRRGGTHNLQAIVGFSFALLQAPEKEERQRREGLRDYFESCLSENFEVEIHSKNVKRLINTSSVEFVGMLSRDIVKRLAEKSIYCSIGSSCSQNLLTASSVILASGRSETSALSTLRFSFGPEISKEQIDRIICELKQIISVLKKETLDRVSSLIA